MERAKDRAIRGAGLAAALALAASPLLAQDCGGGHAAGTPWTQGEAVLFTSRVLNVDADGAPNSYMLDGSGLSYTCDGVLAIEDGRRVTPGSDPAGWQKKCATAWAQARSSGDYGAVDIFGFLKGSDGRPVVQGEGDPLPGEAFVSTTSVAIPGAPDATQRRYVDATRIPYIVLPSSFVQRHGVKPGSLAVVYRPLTGAHAFGVYGDGGGLGEASVKLHEALGSQPVRRIKGTARAKFRIEDPVLTAVFPARVAAPVADADAWVQAIEQEGAAALAAFGGVERLAECAR